MRILLADDDPITLQLLETMLKRLGYEVELARDGNQAWERLSQSPPEIVLLDWMMPGLDGLEICRRLQLQTRDRFIYIILLTANDRSEDITAGLDAGANDYITKPFDPYVLRSRIAVGVRIVEYEKRVQNMNVELRRYSSEMEMLAQERARQLVQADRMVILGTMTAGIAHEVNNPLTILQGNIKLIKRFWSEQLFPWFETSEPAASRPANAKSVSDLIRALENAVERIRQIVDGMRHFSHGQGGQVGVMQLETCLQDALAICLPKTKNRVQVTAVAEPIPFPVKGNPVQITQVLVNLIGNAADALAGTDDPLVTVSLCTADGHAQFHVKDNGPGIATENLEKLWSPFYTTKPVGEGTGLGLFICRNIMEEHGGGIHVNSTSGQGAEFIIDLPSVEEYDRQHQTKIAVPEE